MSRPNPQTPPPPRGSFISFFLTLPRLLLGRRHRLAAAPRGLRVLAAHADAPVVAQAPVDPDLLEPLQVRPQRRVERVREGLRVLARLVVLLSIQKPRRDLELLRVLDDGHELLDLVGRELAGSFMGVDRGFFAHHIGEAAADAGDRRDGVHDLAPPIDVRVEHTQDVLEVGRDDERHLQLVYLCGDGRVSAPVAVGAREASA